MFCQPDVHRGDPGDIIKNQKFRGGHKKRPTNSGGHKQLGHTNQNNGSARSTSSTVLLLVVPTTAFTNKNLLSCTTCTTTVVELVPTTTSSSRYEYSRALP